MLGIDTVFLDKLLEKNSQGLKYSRQIIWSISTALLPMAMKQQRHSPSAGSCKSIFMETMLRSCASPTAEIRRAGKTLG